MKKILLGALLLFSAISCSEDDSPNQVANQETSMNIHLSAQRTNLTGKDVKRGILPVTVNSVVINVDPWTSASVGQGVIDGTRLPSVFNFSVVSDDTVGALDGFEIRNFSTGISLFTVNASSTTTGETINYGSFTGESSTSSVNDLFIKWEAKPVAIKYTSTPQTIDVIAGINTPVSFTLIPANGRVISVFQLSDELKGWNYTAKVQTNFNDVLSATEFFDVDNTHNAVTYIDGVNTYHGAILKHIITIFDDKGEKVAEYPVVIDVTNGESNNTIYTILSDQIPESNQLQTTILVPDFVSPPATEQGI